MAPELQTLPIEYGSLIMGSSMLMLNHEMPPQINRLAAQFAY